MPPPPLLLLLLALASLRRVHLMPHLGRRRFPLDFGPKTCIGCERVSTMPDMQWGEYYTSKDGDPAPQGIWCAICARVREAALTECTAWVRYIGRPIVLTDGPRSFYFDRIPLHSALFY